MKFVIVLACLLAVAYANEDANVIKNEQEVNHDSFHYNLELDNHIKAEQHGQLAESHLDSKEHGHDWIVKGEYEYVSKEGKHHKVSYIADEYGYQPKIETI